MIIKILAHTRKTRNGQARKIMIKKGPTNRAENTASQGPTAFKRAVPTKTKQTRYCEKMH